MHYQAPTLFRITGLVASAALGLSTLHAADAAKPADDKDALPAVTENFVKLSGQYNWTSGDKAAFQAESATAKNGFGGIEEVQFSKDLKNDFTLNTDGHALVGNGDYLAHLNVAKNELGSVDVGYSRFRTYYDNAGGFLLPTTNSWLPLSLFPTPLYVDRSKLWAEANLTLPNAPVVTIRYTNELRNGAKDTTSWGASDYTGLTGLGSSTSVASRFMAPGYLQLGERQQTLEAIAKHTIDKTSIELSVVGNRVDNLDTKIGNRYPGEVKSIPALAGTISPAAIQNLNNAVATWDQLGNKADTLAFTGKVETSLSANARLHAGVSYSLLTSDFTENRFLTTQTPYGTAAVENGVIPVVTADAQGLVGGAKIKTYTANVGADLKVGHDTTIGVGLRGEDRYAAAAESLNKITASAVSAAGIYTQTYALNYGASRTKEDSLTPELNVRYTGIKNISLFGTAEYRYLSGDERVTNLYASTASPTPVFNDVHENHGRYTIGANWVPCTYFTLRAETFYKDNQNNFQAYWNSSGSPAYVLGYQMKGVKLTATLKPLPTVTATTRYIYQTGTMQTAGYINVSGYVPTSTLQSMDAKSHNIGETIDWTPIKQFYLQANINVVFDTTSTAYPGAGASNATEGGNDLLRNADNNYVNGSLIAGFVVDKVTNAEMEYTFYKADNFQPALIATTMPYGMSEKNYTISVGLKRKLTDKLVAEAKVGYMDSTNDTTSGRTNYKGTIAYVALQQAF